MGYKKLQVFDGKQTSWGGLWWHPEFASFSSQVINLAQLREFKGQVRLYVRKNKYYNNGENGRPNYNFCIKDAKSENAIELAIESIKSARLEGLLNQEVITIDDAAEVANGLLRDMEYGYSIDDLVVESYGLMAENAVTINELLESD